MRSDWREVAARNVGLGAFGEGEVSAWVSVGLCREAAIHHSPGLKPGFSPGYGRREKRPESTDRVWLGLGLLIKSGPRTSVLAWATRYDRSSFGRHFQGVSSYAINPGLWSLAASRLSQLLGIVFRQTASLKSVTREVPPRPTFRAATLSPITSHLSLLTCEAKPSTTKPSPACGSYSPDVCTPTRR